MKQEHVFYGSHQLPYGWTEHHIVNTMGFDRYYQIYEDMVVWLYTNVEDCEKNANWFRMNDCIYVYLRRRSDAVMFTLMWS